MIHGASLLGDSHRLTAFLDCESNTERVLYSPDAEEQLVRLGVSREHVETVLAQPTHTARLSKVRTVQLERDFGSHTLRLHVAEPGPAFGAVYVKQVEWCQATGFSPWAAEPTPRRQPMARCHRQHRQAFVLGAATSSGRAPE